MHGHMNIKFDFVFFIKSIRNFREKKKEYFKVKDNDLETNTTNKSIRDVYRDTNEFKKPHQPGTTVVKNEMGNLLTNTHSNADT